MKLIVTEQVTHQINDEYKCLLVQFEPEDKHFYPDKTNWMPKDEEVLKIIAKMLEISPTFQQLFRYFYGGMKKE